MRGDTGVGRTLCGYALRTITVVVYTTLFLELLLLGLTVLAGVISRYIFNYSFSWTEELASWLLIALTFTGMAGGHLSDRHLAFDLTGAIPAPAGVKAARSVVVEFIVSASTILLVFGGLGIIRQIRGLSAALEWDIRIKFVIVPIAGLATLRSSFWSMSQNRRAGCDQADRCLPPPWSAGSSPGAARRSPSTARR